MMSFSRLFERESRPDDRGQLALEDQTHHRDKIAVRSHRTTDDRDVLAEQVTQIDFRDRAAGVADDQDAASLAYRADTAEQRFLADVIHDHIDAAPFGALEDGF